MNIFPKLSAEADNWDVIVIGHLKCNRYFGESPDAPPRGNPSTCTSTLLRGRDSGGKPYVLIIDPTTRLSAEDYYFDLNRRTGLRPEAVTHVFCTHRHLDHYEGFQYFPNAKWLAPSPVLEALRREAAVIDAGRIEPADGEFLPGAAALHLPGHTPDAHGVAFAHVGKKIIAAGDCAMTKYHYALDLTDFQPDPALAGQAAESIVNMRESFDIIIPGHDNIIVV
ncbi:hypothetical protein FACS1894191_8260 [Clostridia bacterium]|nr:hypothetical protein FACS1894191_8260 [Clostridia bacterium]